MVKGGQMEAVIRASSSVGVFTGAIRHCKYKPCSSEFRPRRKDQVFCAPGCKTKYTMTAYERGVGMMESRGMHARSLNSPQLQKLLACLSDGRAWTTKEIGEATQIENVSTAISEMRRAGVNISRAKFVRTTETGAKIFEYKLEERAA